MAGVGFYDRAVRRASVKYIEATGTVGRGNPKRPIAICIELPLLRGAAGAGVLHNLHTGGLRTGACIQAQVVVLGLDGVIAATDSCELEASVAQAAAGPLIKAQSHSAGAPINIQAGSARLSNDRRSER